MHMLGGPVAEFVHRSRGLAGALNISCAIRAYGSVLAVLRRMGGQDFSDISNTDPAVTDDMLLSLVTDTAGLVTMPKIWARVEALAKALMERQKISRDDLSDIYFAVRKPSRVDVSGARELLGASGRSLRISSSGDTFLGRPSSCILKDRPRSVAPLLAVGPEFWTLRRRA